MLTFSYSFWFTYPFIAGAISQEIFQEGQRLVKARGLTGQRFKRAISKRRWRSFV
jgi:hypothetical protein